MQGEQGAVELGLHGAALADALHDVGQVAVFAGAVDDHEDVRATVDEHQVVDDAAFVVEQQAVALLAHGQVDHVHRHERLERGSRIGADEAQLAHVRDVEQAGGGTGVVVFGHQAGGVLHRHAVAGKGHHAGTEFEMQGVQRGLEQVGTGGAVGHGGLSGTLGRSLGAGLWAEGQHGASVRCPSVRFT
ncbi:hypothetical protein D9M69_572440 [compost metagenome]